METVQNSQRILTSGDFPVGRQALPVATSLSRQDRISTGGPPKHEHAALWPGGCGCGCELGPYDRACPTGFRC